MKKLTHGILNWDKVKSSRDENKPGFSNETYDYQNAIEAISKNTKPRMRNLTNFKMSTSRDDVMLQTTDFYKNIELENTREQREMEIEARKTSPLKNLL